MKYSIEELGFILYNNRSVNGVVMNFLNKNTNILKIIKIEDDFEKIKSKYNDDRQVEINTSDLNKDEDDIIVYPKDLEEITDIILSNVGKFNDNEYNYLFDRGITLDVILEYKLLGLSNISNIDILTKIGATVHPILKGFLDDGLDNGGIIIPLFESNILKNCAVRKINILKDSLVDLYDGNKSKTLKYSLACPDVNIWGLNDIKSNSEIWITEGIFDMMALKLMGKNAVSCSSAMWSGPQLNSLLETKPSNIIIVSDKDSVGLKVSMQLKELFTLYNIDTKTVISKIAKDPAEHYFEKNKGIEYFEEIDITIDMIKMKIDDSFNFIKYLKNRNF